MAAKVIGILGGMGPEATWDLFGRIIKGTPAAKDSDHHRVIIDSNPNIPDRTQAILETGPSPVEMMITTGKNLELAGAGLILVPCMTAHAFIEPLQTALSVPVVNAFDLMRRHLSADAFSITKVAVIATSGSLKSGLYQHYLRDFQLILPEPEMQEKEIMDLIYGPQGIKAGHVNGQVITRLNRLIAHFQSAGAEAVIAGCTEIGLVLKGQPMPLPVIDPLDLMTFEAIRWASN